LAASLNLIHSIGQQDIAEHVVSLTDQLMAGLDRLPVTVVTPRARENRSGIVTFSVGSAEDNVRLMNRLLEKKILVSVRYTSKVGGVRVSCHLYNSAEDIETLLAEVKGLLN
jgi:selenocysteine lyase/cysteine desulfurase